MGKTLQLGGDGGLDPWMAVPGVEHRDATGEIDEAAPFDIPELGVLGMVDEEVPEHGHATRRGGQAALVPVGI